MIRSVLMVVSVLLAIAFTTRVNAQFDAAETDRVVERAMEAFQVPGMAVGVVKGSEVIYARGHGLRETGQRGEVDGKTLFRIASASKAFTAAAVAVLVDRGELDWEGAVVDYLPGFRLSDPWVTSEINLADLLSHRSGLAPFAGDLMLWPAPNRFTAADIVHGLRYFPLQRGFRRGYSYENVLYVTAGEVVARVSGQSWGDFVDKHVTAPLGMERCFAGRIPARKLRNLAAPHSLVEGELQVVDRNRIREEPTTFAPAGGVACSLDDLLTWVQAHLAEGVSGGGEPWLSPAQVQRLWTPHNLLGVSDSARREHNTHFSAYGLGWRLRDIQGYQEVSHTGSLDGWRAWVLMIPELELGIVVLGNASSSAARNAVMYSIEYAFLPGQSRDWVAHYLEQEAASEQATAVSESEPLPTPLPAREIGAYAGNYRSPWFGDVTVSRADGALRFEADRSPRLAGSMTHYSGDTFFVRWDDRSMGLDAYARFETDPDGRVRRLSLEQKQDDGQYEADNFEFLDLRRVSE